MFKRKKYTFILLVGTILLAACGTQPFTENIPSNIEQTTPAAPTEQQNTQEPDPVQAETNAVSTAELTYPIVDTDQCNCYDAQNQVDCPQTGSAFFGQDAQYNGNQPSYTDHGDGTVTDNVTGLMWQQDPGEKMPYDQAVAGASNLILAGYSDWRLPSIKELYSLIQFDGLDPSGPSSTKLVPFIDTDYFSFEYGDESAGERVIDSQWATSTKYVSTTMNGKETMFGVNFADGRIKGYPTQMGPGGQPKTFFVIYVRGNMAYGENSFVDNADGTISDNATGLTWTQSDSASGMNWEAALNYCESLDTAGITDWRLPNVKELQSIVDYSLSPDTTNSAAIDPIFSTSTITNEAGQVDYPAFWSSTTHANQHSGGNASYVSFGRAMGNMNGRWMDVHGAGAQRSDPKTGSSADWPTGHGPQGDAIRVDNYVRCVTDSTISKNVTGNPDEITGGEEGNTQPSQGQSEAHNEDAAVNVSYLFSPIRSTSTFLMDAEGEAVFTWESNYTPGQSVYLLENGNLLRTGSVKSNIFTAGGLGGIIEEMAPDGTVVWSFQYANDLVQQHHDIEELPNGNILLIAWEFKSQTEAINAGRSPDLLKDGAIWADHIIEVDPSTNSIVWEWHVWDHLIQDYDSTKENYGVVADHPERIDLNFTNRMAGADWNHTNAVDYNAKLDQILLSVHSFSEIWIIDHSISTQEAAGTAGDLLYRWGNPQTYDAGTAADQQLYAQHDAQWISAGRPGGENILVFNNGDKRERPYSSVDEIAPPLNADGSYALTSSAYDPEAPTWAYTADNPSDFYADHISGAQRLPNGNTLICSGTDGLFFEVTPSGETVWRYDYGGEVFRVTRYEADYAGLPDSTLYTQMSVESPAGQPATGAGQNTSRQGQPPQLDFTSAAAQLGITEELLRSALGPPPPDFAAAAAQLGVTEQMLMDALDIPAGGPPNGE